MSVPRRRLPRPLRRLPRRRSRHPSPSRAARDRLGAATRARDQRRPLRHRSSSASGALAASSSRELREVDLLASRFREDSELTAPERVAPESSVRRASALLFDAARGWRSMSARPHRRARRPDCRPGAPSRRLRRVPSSPFALADGRVSRRLAPRRRVGRASGSSRSTLEIRVPAGVELDLGATAKARGGGRRGLRRCTGSTGSGRPRPPRRRRRRRWSPCRSGGWPIRIADRPRTHRLPPDRPVVAVHGGGVASVGNRRTPLAGARRRTPPHHRSAHRWLSSHALAHRHRDAAHTCVDANAASTAAVVLGADARCLARAPRLLRPAGPSAMAP